MELYYQFTKDQTYIKKHLHLLDREHQFWLDHRTVKVKVAGREHALARYAADLHEPRPEGYMCDVEVTQGMSGKKIYCISSAKRPRT